MSDHEEPDASGTAFRAVIMEETSTKVQTSPRLRRDVELLLDSSDAICATLDNIADYIDSESNSMPQDALDALKEYRQDRSRTGRNFDFIRRINGIVKTRALDVFMAKNEGFKESIIDVFCMTDPWGERLPPPPVTEEETDISMQDTRLESAPEEQIPLKFPHFLPFADVFKPRNVAGDQVGSGFGGHEEEGVKTGHSRGKSTGLSFQDFTKTRGEAGIHMQDAPDVPASGPRATGSRHDDDPARPPSPDFEILGDLPTVPTPADIPISSRNAYNDRWLRDWLRNKVARSAHDLALHPYKGWKIEAPKIQLIRAKNFLADEDADRTVDWQRKFGELAEYFAYLLQNYKGEDWGYDLREAIDMLHTHWVTESYHYGRSTLNLDFPDVWPKSSARLPQLPGINITMSMDDRPRQPIGEQPTFNTELGSPFDPQYGLSPEVLDEYLRDFKFDTREWWNSSLSAKNLHSIRGQRRLLDLRDRWFNMAHEENCAYEECMREEGSERNAKVVKILNSEGRFQFSPNDIVENETGAKEISVDSLRAFAKSRGSRRAGLQQCLNMIDNRENWSGYSPWSVLRLPEPYKPEEPGGKPDAGIVVPTLCVEGIPKKAARDPFAYTVAYRQHMKQEKYWAEWTRKHSTKEAHGHRQWSLRKEPVMDIPANFKGPYPCDYMDHEMKKVSVSLKNFGVIMQGLARADRWAPRKLVTEMLELIEEGRNNENWRKLKLKFRDDEFVNEDSYELLPLRPAEVKWMGWPAYQSTNANGLKEKPDLGPSFKMFEQRVEALLRDINPEALFRDKSPKPLDEFLSLLNGTTGPVKRYQFARKEAIQHAQAMSQIGTVKFGYDSLEELAISRPDVDIHPEDVVTWSTPRREDPDSEPSTGQNDNEIRDGTISTELSAPDSEAELGNYKQHLPDDMVYISFEDWHNASEEDKALLYDAPRTHNFFRCLAYRFGFTLQALEAEFKEMKEKLTPEQKLKNKKFLAQITRSWQDDAERRPNNPHKNPDKFDWERITPSLDKVVKWVDEENYKPEWASNKHPEESPEAFRLVQRGLIHEAWENKETIWPTRLDPSDDPEKGEKLTPWRDPVWRFGLERKSGPRFFDINRWPLHLQSEETQEKIKAGGPKNYARTRRGSQPSDVLLTGDLTLSQLLHEKDEEEETVVTYADLARSRRRFQPGPPEFWLGDTPLQRKVMEQRAWEELGLSQEKPKTWTERIRSAFFGPKKEVDPTALPEVDPKDIPKSRPGPVTEMSGSWSGEPKFVSPTGGDETEGEMFKGRQQEGRTVRSEPLDLSIIDSPRSESKQEDESEDEEMSDI